MNVFFDALLELFWPTRCVLCNRSGYVLCPFCKSKLSFINPKYACKFCGAPFGYLSCTACKKDWEIDFVVCALSFDEGAGEVVKSYKDKRERRLKDFIASSLYEAYLAASLDEYKFDWLCYVPASKQAMQKRGFDHMKQVALQLQEYLAIPCAPLLKKDKRKDQRRLSRKDRSANMQAAFSLDEQFDLRGASILLIDDVITSGATIREASLALKAAGAKRVVALAFARVW
ncbi:MAG: phosphoribosyltransferase family protein [Coriobacteriia bacterium]|nr:phosphoribosyltransferase family protein [Coriobacteriia bacterium]